MGWAVHCLFWKLSEVGMAWASYGLYMVWEWPSLGVGG
jgi:hypothetical protein